MKILVLTRYGPLGASSRLRFHQYFRYLEEHGAELTISPLFDDAYVGRLYSGRGRSPIEILAAYGRRVAMLRDVRQFDLVWLEKELLPWLPAWLERFLCGTLPPLVIDLDDAIFHSYDIHRSALVRSALGNKIARLMSRARLVTAGNEYLAAYAIQAGTAKVETLPTVVDTERYQVPSAGAPKGRPLRIGWIGSPATERYLASIFPALESVALQVPLELVAVGAGKLPGAGFPVEIRAWTEATEAAEIAGFDVGIMPLPDGPWERGKCGYKLIQYMACGKPVIASPVGVNTSIVRDGSVCGFLASDTDAWAEAIRRLADDYQLRRQLGAAGREKVERQYSLQVSAPRLWQLLQEAAEVSR